MKTEVAVRIQELRTGNIMHSWRKIAEIICDEFPVQPYEDGWESTDAAWGNQLYGKDLCEEAAELLGVTPEDYDYFWETSHAERTPR